MSENTFISVVVPVFNAENHISKCLTSFENQTFKDFNIILVDDCSKDDTYNVITEYRLKSPLEIICYKNERNSGPAASRNIGITLSKAKYIAFCDSDDWYDNDYLEQMANAAKQSNADIVFCGHKLVFSDMRNDYKHTLPVSGDIDKKTALALNIDSLCTTLVKRGIAQSTPIADLRNGEDMAVIPVWILKAERFFCINSELYNYFVREGSLSNKSTLKVVDSLEKSFDFIVRNFDEKYSFEIEYIGIRNLIYGGLLNLFKCEYNKTRANKILNDFEKKFPNWGENPYIANLSFYKRFFIRFAERKNFVAIWFMAKVHSFLTK